MNVSACRKRERFADGPMFFKAFDDIERNREVQRSRVHVAGFLREDGTSVCKNNSVVFGNMSIFKVVLLNLQELKKLNVRYNYKLKAFEDVCFLKQVIDAGGATMKNQDFSFQALVSRAGGAEKARASMSKGITLAGLVGKRNASNATGLPKAVLAIQDWVNKRECMSQTRSAITRA